MHASKKRKGNEEPMDVDENPDQPVGLDQNGGNIENDDVDHISDDEEGGVRIGDIYIPPAPKPALTFDTTGPRLIITHIVNENFKSYAGVQQLGPFHKSFSAIIGPNGSGKSNVIDSMLFVFGYRATKIRSKKISVLIHSSSKFPNITNASVAVHFSKIIDGEGEEFTIVPNSEIVVSRTAHKDNSSYYTLNGRRVQFKEVAKMLRTNGIDLDHNRFLILQGEVEQIAMMKPKALTEHESGMLEYLEDIIGTSRYKQPIELLSVKVEEFSDMRKEKLNRVRLVEQEKIKLEQPMREAVELMNLTNTSLRTRNMLLQKYIHETNKIIDSKKMEMDGLKNSLSIIDENLVKVKEELHEKTTELKNGTQKYDTLRKQKDEVAEKLKSCKTKTVSAQADTTQANKKKKNLEQLLEQERGKLIELELVPEKNKRDIEDCEKLLEKNEESKTQAEQELQTLMASVREKTQGFQDEKVKLKAKLIELNNKVCEATKELNIAKTELKTYLGTEEREIEILNEVTESYENTSKSLAEKKTRHQELSVSVPQQERELTQLREKLKNLNSEESSIEKEVRTLRNQVETSQQAMSANNSRGRVLAALMEEKKSGRLPGIFGRLGDLGGIDAKYDVAISTGCGALDNIVVDTIETGTECVKFLKRNGMGYTTFIALADQQHLIRTYEIRRTYPENVPRLFDLVTVKDKRILPAFYYALRDTLVATNLDQASRIGYGTPRYRVVSLNGDVIEKSGTMSGGGRNKIRGKMGSSVTNDTSQQDPRELRAAEARLESLQARFNELKREQTEIQNKLASLQSSAREDKTMHDKLEIELKSLTEMLTTYKAHMKRQKVRVASTKVDANHKAELERNLNAAEEKLKTAKHNAGEVEKEVHGIDAQILAVTGTKVGDLQKKVDEHSKKIDKVSSEITKLRVAINTSIRNAKKSKDKINQMDADLKETLKNLENLSNQKKQLTLDSSRLQKEFDELEEQINEGTGEFSGLRQEISKLQSKENKAKSERLEMNNAIGKMEKSIQECTSKTPMWKKELTSLKLEDPGLDGVPGIERPTPLEVHSAEELEECVVEELRHRLAAQKSRIGDAKPNIQAIQDYRTKEEVYLKRAAELDEITTKRNEMRALYDQLRKKRTTDFLSGFNTITNKLKEMYQMITLGGDAELELVDSLDPFTEGIIFSVRPPNKSWKNISNLSGGEKTLSSLALVFALHYYRPTPLYVMDEIDAALDFKNVSIVANYINERTKNAQFIIISLRHNMFEVCNRLVGIYKTEDCTKCVSIDNILPANLVVVDRDAQMYELMKGKENMNAVPIGNNGILN